MTTAAASFDSADSRKARGAFFTPPALCDYICEWAVRDSCDVVLEPSCGEAAFLTAAAARLDRLGAPARTAQLWGVELHEASAAAARTLMTATGRPAEILTADFFDRPAERRFDAVVGNPPFVRYQGFSGEARTAGRAAALRGGVGLTALASSWAAFTVHAAEFLLPGGRLGLVLPAELLTVNYASTVRRYLMEQFGRVRLVVFTERIFPGVLEEVVLVLAEDAQAQDGTDHCELRQVTRAADLSAELKGHRAEPRTHRWRPADVSGKWTPALLPAAALDVYGPLAAGAGFAELSAWGDTTLGAVTGRNDYFALDPAGVRQLRLRPEETVAISPPGSRHLRGLNFTGQAWQQMGEQGARTVLFRPGADRRAMSAGARRYLAAGEAAGVDAAYKCRVRSPWWQVPLVAEPDLFLTYMNADTPRLSTNTAGVRHLNSVHGLYLTDQLRPLGRSLLPLASLNSLTLLGAELVGRAYGGGMLKLEPREADLLPVPSPALLEQVGNELLALRRPIRDALRRSGLPAAVRIVDDLLLRQVLELTDDQHTELVAAHALMAARRAARGRSASPSRRRHG